MYFSYDLSVGEGVYGGWGVVWVIGWAMGWCLGGEDLKWRGFNFTKEIPLNKFSEMIEILLKLEKNVQKRRVTRGVLKHLTFSMIFKKHISP